MPYEISKHKVTEVTEKLPIAPISADCQVTLIVCITVFSITRVLFTFVPLMVAIIRLKSGIVPTCSDRSSVSSKKVEPQRY